MIEEIKELWPSIKNKTDFIVEFSKVIGRSPLGLKNNWFSTFWQVPKAHQPFTLDYIKEYLKKQNTE